MESVFIIDPSRCIGCQACVQGCGECDTHRGTSMIHLEFVDREHTVQTTPQVCMHCENPTCALVCPADAIKQTPDGVVQSSLKPRCIGCSNCVLACPFGVPKYYLEIDQMMKCDMCYDRTSVGKKPMCATVCPSEALYYGSLEEWERRRRGKPVNEWKFGNQYVKTKVHMVMPEATPRVDVQLGDIKINLRTEGGAQGQKTAIEEKPLQHAQVSTRIKPHRPQSAAMEEIQNNPTEPQNNRNTNGEMRP